jgi:hypothetical protein
MTTVDDSLPEKTKVQPTKIGVLITVEDAVRLEQAFRDGKLAEFGITDLKIKDWSTTELRKRQESPKRGRDCN